MVRVGLRAGVPRRHAFEADVAGEGAFEVEDAGGSEWVLTPQKHGTRGNVRYCVTWCEWDSARACPADMLLRQMWRARGRLRSKMRAGANGSSRLKSMAPG